MADGIDAFADLARWLDHDTLRWHRVVAVFHRTMMCELVALEHAAARGEWHEVRRLADRMALGCVQVGEAGAADCLAPFGNTAFDVTIRATYFAWYVPRRATLLRLVERAADVAMGVAA